LKKGVNKDGVLTFTKNEANIGPVRKILLKNIKKDKIKIALNKLPSKKQNPQKNKFAPNIIKMTPRYNPLKLYKKSPKSKNPFKVKFRGENILSGFLALG
jgi:hypothetical protein